MGDILQFPGNRIKKEIPKIIILLPLLLIIWFPVVLTKEHIREL